MCGIVGRVGRGPVDLAPALAAITHRGPDDRGTYRHESQGATVDLGFVRLAILDLSPLGHQPMTNEDETVWLVFNGEIYNYRELRAELLAAGHRFRSETDSETIIHAYEEWGDACLQRLRGMFGLAIWDEKRQRLLAARDRLGIKPFFWTNGPATGFAFASEMKALLALGAARDMDTEALRGYLRYLYVPRPRTIFKHIQALSPGFALTWENGTTRTFRYWDLPQTPQTSMARDDATVVRELRALLDDVVRMHLASDVPLGAFLSGGLDSSTLVALMTRHSSKPVRTFCMTFGPDEGLYDEREHAATVARAFGTDHTEIPVKPEVVDLLPQAVRHFDEPFGNPTALLSYLLARETRKHVTVALAGDGGDEVFLGYPRYLGARVAELYHRLPSVLRSTVADRVAPLIRDSQQGRHGWRRAREFLETGALDLRVMYENWLGYFSPQAIDDLVGAPANGPEASFIASLFNAAPARAFLDQITYVDLKSFLPFNLLQYTDRMSMAHSLEVRVPFCDHVLVEFMASLPHARKMTPRTSKTLLRAAVADLLPESIMRRKKLGFNPPMGIWLRRDLSGLIEDKLSPARLARDGIFRPQPIREMVDAYRAGGRDYSLQIWALLVFQTWMDLYQ